MEKLKKNLIRNGQIENIIVRNAKAKGYYEVVNGNHRLKALVDIGVKKIVCYNLGKISQAHAERIAIETNETKFAADKTKLGELLAHISESFKSEDLLETLPFSEDEMAKYLKTVEVEKTNKKNPDDFDPGGKAEDWTEISLKLPADLAVMFSDQLDRVKKALYPNKQTVSIVPAIECITQHIALMPDSQLRGG